MKIIKGQKAMVWLAALGILGFSAYGITSTVKAAEQANVQNAAEQTILATQAQGSLTPGGTICNPYGCAACAGCINLQYQQTVETLPSASTETFLY
jgi:hypothetical protein